MQGFRTIIANTVGAAALWLGTKYGLDISADTQAALVTIIMAVANIGLRFVTTTPVFTKE